MIDEELKQYNISLTRAYMVTDVSSQIIDIAVNAINKISEKSNDNALKTYTKNQSDMMKNILNSPTLSDSSIVIAGQQVVLIVTALEVFLSDIVRKIGNNYRSKLVWHDDSVGKVDLTLISNSAITIGDIILNIVKQKGISSQDLQSIKRFFSTYLNIDINLSNDDEAIIIFAIAARHCILHSGSLVNDEFLKHVRNTEFCNKYKYGETLSIEASLVRQIIQTFNRFGRKVNDNLVKFL